MRKSRGFTLIELIMVIAIIGILAAIAIPKFQDFSLDAKRASTKGALGALRSVLAIEYSKNALAGTPSYPTTINSSSFANGQDPLNAISAKSGVVTTTAIPGSTATHASAGFWYIQTGASAGRAGAFSNGTENTSTY